MIVGYQGEPGAFSEEAVTELFGPVRTRGYESFDALVAAVDARQVDAGLLPCENSIHGPVTRAYDLLYAHPHVCIVNEAVHRIVQALIGPPGARLEDVRRVESHPVAIEQCRRYLNGMHGVEAVAVSDTAGAVRAVVAANDPSRAAIGPAKSAQRYGGVILAEAIQDQAENYTRFFVIRRDAEPRGGLGRAAIAFTLPHEPGSLHRALGVIAERGMNLRSLVARPQPGRPFEYVFYVEIDCPQGERAAELVASLGEGARLIGWY